MFKPSLRKSVLNDNLYLTTQTKNDCFGSPVVQKPKPIIRYMDTIQFAPKVKIPSMMIPEQILEKHEFKNNNNYTHLFTPLSYDFKAYPQVVKQIINPNPKAAQAGRINKINYVIYQNNLLLWKSINNKKDEQKLKIHRFKQKINIAQFQIIKNEKIFRKQKVLILAISFGNRLKLFKVDQAQLNLEDLMIKYQLKSCKFIQKIYFTDKNQIIFAGDSGQFSMISLNSSKQFVVKIKSSIIQKYLSKSAFDYFTRHLVRQIQTTQSFIYCLHDKISKSNYFMYLIKNAINKFIILPQKPQYIHEQTFIDIYKFTNQERKQIAFVGQLNQKDIQKKIKQGYVNFWGEGVKDPFRIISINAKGQQSWTQQKKPLEKSNQLLPFLNDQVIKVVSSTTQAILVNPVIQITTKCGYVFKLTHQNINEQKNSKQEKQAFSFVIHPTKIPQKIGDASIFEPKVFMASPQQKQYRNNFIVKALPIDKDQNILLMNDSLILNRRQSISAIKFDDLKTGLFETTNEQQYYISEQQFLNLYKNKSVQQNQEPIQQNIFARKDKKRDSKIGQKFIRVFNNQRRWTVFDNEGRFHIYQLQLKNILLAYVYYECQFINKDRDVSSNRYDNHLNLILESNIRLSPVVSKIIKVYGYNKFMKSIVQILINNSSEQREYFYLQRQILSQVIRRQLDIDIPNSFEDWNYSLGQHNQGIKIIVSDKMLQCLWILLEQNQNKYKLTSEIVFASSLDTQYHKKVNQFNQLKVRLQYTSYGYALKSIFYQCIKMLIPFRARQFKYKEKQLNKTKRQLLALYNFLQNKKIKQSTNQFRYFHDAKINKISKNEANKKFKDNFSRGIKNLNNTMSTVYSNSLHNSESSFIGFEDQNQISQTQNTLLNRGITYQSNEVIQKSIMNSIHKIISLIDVMNILIQKDQRQGLPNFIQIVTNFSNQILIGQQFFKEQLFLTDNQVQFVHPQLVKQTESILPQLQLTNKIDFLKFKIAKNIVNKSLNQVDLKSLNFDKLSQITTSNQLAEVKRMFLGQRNDLSYQNTYFYVQFLTICLTKLIKKVRELSNIKQKKYESFSEGSQGNNNLLTHITIQKIVLTQQQLQYYQKEMRKIFIQIKETFNNIVKRLCSINGKQYYQAQKYLDRTLQLLVKNFGTQQIMIQTMQIILKDYNLLQKVHQMKKIKDKLIYMPKQDTQFLKVNLQKSFSFQQKSTFSFLNTTKLYKEPRTQRTQDTWKSNSFN